MGSCLRYLGIRFLRLSNFKNKLRNIFMGIQQGTKVFWKSAYDPNYWGGYVKTGDTGTVLRVRQLGNMVSVQVEWDRIIKSQFGNDIHQVTNADTRDLGVVQEESMSFSNRLDRAINEALAGEGDFGSLGSDVSTWRIPLSQCHKEDDGLYTWWSDWDVEQNAGALVAYVDKKNLDAFTGQDPRWADAEFDMRSAFDPAKLAVAKPDANGLYYIPDLYTEEAKAEVLERFRKAQEESESLALARNRQEQGGLE